VNRGDGAGQLIDDLCKSKYYSLVKVKHFVVSRGQQAQIDGLPGRGPPPPPSHADGLTHAFPSLPRLSLSLSPSRTGARAPTPRHPSRCPVHRRNLCPTAPIAGGSTRRRFALSRPRRPNPRSGAGSAAMFWRMTGLSAASPVSALLSCLLCCASRSSILLGTREAEDQRCSALEPRLLRVGFAAVTSWLCAVETESSLSSVIIDSRTFMALTKLAKKQNKTN